MPSTSKLHGSGMARIVQIVMLVVAAAGTVISAGIGVTNGSPPNWQLLHLDPATSPENGTPESNSCLECNRALEQLPEFEDGCRKRGMLRQAPTKGGNCSCACVACEVMAPRCDPSSSCVLGAPIRVPHNKWTCCRPCLAERTARCAFAQCTPQPDCAELENVDGKCCPRCKRRVSSCPGVQCPRIASCVKYHMPRQGHCCAKCRKWNVADKGVCTSVKCGKGQMCVPSPEGDAPVCQCRLKCSRKEYKVCGTDGREYRNSCEMHRQACVHGRRLRVYTVGPCHNHT